MDFHLHQAQARSRTRRLVLLFVLAVVLVMLAVNVAGALIWGMVTPGLELPPYFVATNSAIVLFYVVGGAWLEWQRLLEGGASVAHRLGAETPNPYNLRHQRLLNVTEEMAIAAGIPVPEIFTLDHDSINALTAGHDPSHCAIVVTRGTLENLTRSELQGVIAHEIAHIVNGDVGLNTRLTGALYGLYSLNMLGRAMLSGAFRPRRDDPRLLPWPLLAAGGVVLASVGWIGALGGRIVQAGVSRQREFLADAQAVQFTRDRDSLGRVLRKIAGQGESAMSSEYSEVVAHLWLASEDKGHGWFDTHPPLMTRIRRLHGRPLPAIQPELVQLREQSAEPVAATATDLDQAIDMPRHDPQLVCEAQDAVESVVQQAAAADVLILAARNLGSNMSQAALLLNAIVAGPVSGEDDEESADAELHHALQWLEEPRAQWLRVPLIELLTSRVRHWPLECRKTLVRYCHDAVLADGRIEKTEWIYYTLVRHRLLPEESACRQWASSTLKRRALAEVFSMAGHLSAKSARQVREAVVVAAANIGIEQPTATPEQFEFGSLSRALDVLHALAPLRKPLLLKSLQLLCPKEESAIYQAFLVAVAAAIDCPPLEPLVPLSERMRVMRNTEEPIQAQG